MVQAQQNDTTIWARPIVSAVGSEATPCLNKETFQYPSFFEKVGAHMCQMFYMPEIRSHKWKVETRNKVEDTVYSDSRF